MILIISAVFFFFGIKMHNLICAEIKRSCQNEVPARFLPLRNRRNLLCPHQLRPPTSLIENGPYSSTDRKIAFLKVGEDFLYAINLFAVIRIGAC